MTNPLPESAVELAARAIAAVHIPSFPWLTISDHNRDMYRRMASAALPAIREAVVGELAALIERKRRQADMADHAKATECMRGAASAIRIFADELAALTEQENRNG